MSNFLEDIETIKTFHKFLGVVLNQVEKGEKVDFKSVSNLSKLINGYFESCKKNNTSPTSESKPNKEDTFLKDILSGDYEGTKIRKSINFYDRFKLNESYY